MGKRVCRAKGTRTLSAWAPGRLPRARPKPKTPPLEQAKNWPLRQAGHSPQATWKLPTTRSPTGKGTRGPFSTMRPTNSCPRTVPGRTPVILPW